MVPVWSARRRSSRHGCRCRRCYGARLRGLGYNNAGYNNWSNAYAAQGDPYYGQAQYVPRAYYGHSPYYGYSGWDDYAHRNAISCTPGSTVKLDDGQMYLCQ
jgi:hypothetical protein